MKPKNRISYYIIISGFLIHLILGTLHSWSSISRYFHSFLVQQNSIKISKVYLNNIFSFVIVFYNIFILIGILLTKNYNTITITGFGLLLKIYANVIGLIIKNICECNCFIFSKYNNSNILYIYLQCGIWYMLYAYYLRNLEIFSRK